MLPAFYLEPDHAVNSGDTEIRCSYGSCGQTRDLNMLKLEIL